MIRIIAADLDSIAGIARLSTQLGYPQTEDEARSALQAIRAEGSGEVLVALQESAVVGWIHVLLAPRLESGMFAEICGLVVDSAVRGRGIGTRLVQRAEQWAADRGMPTLRVRSNVIREDAHRFYAALGYDAVKTQTVFWKKLPQTGTKRVKRAAISGVLERIVVFPVKSLDGVDVVETDLSPAGGILFDRSFMIADGDGMPVNGKRDPRVHRIRSSYDFSARRLSLRRDGDGESQSFSVDEERAELEAWLSRALEQPVSLREDLVGFPDDREAPGPTLISAESLEQVAGWFPGLTPAGLARRFRVNLIVRGFPPFGEDALVPSPGENVRFRIGPVMFRGVNPCQRCAVPSRDPETGESDPRFAKTFAARRRETLPPWAPRDRFDHFYRFTVNTAPSDGPSRGTLRVGAPVEIVE